MQINLPTSKRFAEENREEMSTGVWSSFATILLKEIIIVPHKMYDDVVYYANSNFCTIHAPEVIVLCTRTTAQTHSKVTSDGAEQ